jgi:DUF2950 family protein
MKPGLKISFAAMPLAALLVCVPYVSDVRAAQVAPAKNSHVAFAQRSFPSPEDAAKALAAAMRADDVHTVHAVLGRGSEKLIYSGDKVADNRMRDNFVAAYDKSMKLDRQGDAKATLIVGENDFPFPYPLVKDTAGWHFDAKAGADEIINRRIGANELAAIQVCLAYVDAQREYSLRETTGKGLPEYAQKLVSTPGKHDGLYWDAKEGEPPSPLGPLGEQARREGYGKGKGGGAYHGYRYRILTGQGKDAPGGVYHYVVKGRMIGGFGLVAWPARWGASGVMTFICNHGGVVYEKNLGPQTAAAAEAMTRFNPDSTWKKDEN